jgi:hypothetical protein
MGQLHGARLSVYDDVTQTSVPLFRFALLIVFYAARVDCSGAEEIRIPALADLVPIVGTYIVFCTHAAWSI